MQDIFDIYPNLRLVHHKDEDLRNVHITYVTRTNPLPVTLKNALVANYPRYAFEYTRDKRNGFVDIASIFEKRQNPVVIEIGFGCGENSLLIAMANPGVNYLAFDVYLYGFATYMKNAADAGLDNVKLCRYDAEDFIRHSVAEKTIDGFNVFFPDPWLKRKQIKRRIINPGFVKVMSECLKPGGIIHLATDIEDYAQYMLSVLGAEELLENCYGGFAPNRVGRFETSFEKKGSDADRMSFDIVFRRL